MALIQSTRAQVKSSGGLNVIPDSAEVPAAHTHFLNVANALEPKIVLRTTTIAAADTALAPLENGMVVATTTAPYGIYVRQGGAWKKIWPVIYSGTAAPAAGTGADGDIYVMY